MFVDQKKKRFVYFLLARYRQTNLHDRLQVDGLSDKKEKVEVP